MATAEQAQGGKEKRRFTPERKGTLLQAAGVIVTGVELAAVSLVGIAAGILIFAAGSELKKPKNRK